jgi:phenylacetic acid degradation operon negative regulatory protein
VDPTPRSLILDLLSTLRRGSFPVGALVEAGGFFGLEEGSIRVALARLLEAGLVERAARGRYRIGAGATAVQRRLLAWRESGQRMQPWSGTWVGVQEPEPGGADRGARQRGERALRLLGFRELCRGLRIRPDNLAGGVDGVRTSLAELGLPDSALIFALSGFDPGTEQRARGLWDVAALRQALREARRALERSERRLPRLAPREAMVESFQVGGQALRVLALDPLLPEPIGPTEERQALVAAMRRYDELGKASWAGFREQHGVLSSQTPTDTRSAALAAAGGMA